MPIKSKSQEEGPVNQSRSERERDGVGGEQKLYLRDEPIDVCMYSMYMCMCIKRDIQKCPCFDTPLSFLWICFHPSSLSQLDILATFFEPECAEVRSSVGSVSAIIKQLNIILLSSMTTNYIPAADVWRRRSHWSIKDLQCIFNDFPLTTICQ